MSRVPHTEADHQNRLGAIHREQRDVSERAHIALRESPGRGHRMPVGDEGASRAGYLGHADHLGQAFTQAHELLVRSR